MSRAVFITLSCVLAAALGSAPHASAQTATRRVVPSGDVSGLEMGIEGSLSGVPGGRVRWFVTTYEVIRHRDLRLAPNTRLVVTSSLSRSAPLAELTTDARGRAELELALPEEPAQAPSIRIEATSSHGVRRVFSVTLELLARERIELFTDRATVPPRGEALVFGRVLDEATDAPRAGVEVHLSDREAPLTTDASGVFVATVRAPGEGALELSARTESASQRITISAAEAGERTLFARATARRAVARPGDDVPVDVVLRTPDGAPVAGAAVRWSSVAEEEDERRRIVTDASGHAEINWLIARTSEEPVAPITRELTIVSPAEGTTTAVAHLRIARVPWLAAFAVEGGSLTPTLDARIYARVVTPDGLPLRSRAVSLESTALGGRIQATTDEDGVAVFDAPQVSSGANGACGGGTAAAATFHVDADQIPVCLPVDPDATIGVRATLVSGGIHVEAPRTSAARSAPIEIAALTMHGQRWAPIAAAVIEPTARAITLPLPEATRGLVWVRARPLLDGGVAARGGSTLLEVGATGDAPELHADASGATVRSEGSSVVVAGHVGRRDHLAAVLATAMNDAAVASDAGHSPRFVAALLAARTPSDDGASAVLREGAIVTQPLPQTPLDYGLLRDPHRTRARFVRGRIGRLMRAVETYVVDAIPDRLDDAAVREGGRWRFNRSVLDAALEESGLGDEMAASLDGEPLDIATLGAMDPSFTYDNVARRITRERLFRVNVMLRELVRDRGLDVPWGRRGDPQELVVSLIESVERYGVSFTEWPERTQLYDAWGQPLVLRRTARARFGFLQPVAGWELTSGGPDGRVGTGDDLVDPFARVLPSASLYAEAVGEDVLLARLSSVSLGRATAEALASVFQIEAPSAWEPAPQTASTLWRDLPAPPEPDPDPAFESPDVLGGAGPRLEWELPSERRTYQVTAVAFSRSGAIRTSHVSLTAGAPWVARVDLPSALRVGERLALPIVLVRLAEAPAPRLALEASGDALAASLDGSRLTLEARAPGMARVRVLVHLGDGPPAVFERRVRVLPDAALRSRTAVAFERDGSRLSIHTPGDAMPLSARLTVSSAHGLIREPELAPAFERSPAIEAWALALTDRDLGEPLLTRVRPGAPIVTACALSAWARDERRAGLIAEHATHLRQSLATEHAAELDLRASVLAALATEATIDPSAGEGPVALLVADLRQDGWRALARESDHPAVMARLAAALLIADPSDSSGAALLERASSRLTEDRFGRRWVPGRSDHPGDVWIGTAALAIAARQAGRTELADQLAASVAARLGALARLGDEGAFWVTATAVYGGFGADEPESVEVRVDGEARTLSLEDGRAELALPASADVEIAPGSRVVARAEARYLAPVEARDAGAIGVRLEGSPTERGRRAGLELVAQNRGERDVAAARLEVTLPGAAACDRACLEALRASDAVARVDDPDRAGVLRVTLAPIPVGVSRRVPLSLRWVAAGRTRGLAVEAYDLEAPSERATIPARTLTVGVER
ncbi:MAG: hypothetical protein AB7S26_34400 [Sandaracinaceae bacterium]